MKIKNSTFLIILLLGAAAGPSFGQVRMNISDYISSKLDSYSRNAEWEEVYVRTDRDTYIAGEEVWLAAYTFNRRTMERSDESKLIYVELLTGANKPLMKFRFSLENGAGAGQIMLPDTLSSGTYCLRAYTGWMKNFLPDNCFIKDISVYNAISDRPYRNKVKAENKENSDCQGSKASMKIGSLGKDSLMVEINTSEEFRNSGNEAVYLVAETHGKLDINISAKLDGDVTRISLPRKSLTPGINHFTIFDRNIDPVCEKYFYSPELTDKDRITLKSTRDFKTRSKVTIEFELPADLAGSDVCISASAGQGSGAGNDASSYLLFGSEFGSVPNDFLHGRRVDMLSGQGLDSLLSMISSRWIKWKEVLEVRTPFFSFTHETGDHYLTGKMVKADGKPVAEGEFVVLSVPGRTPIFQYAITDKNGNFSFPLPIDQQKRDLVIQPGGRSANYKIIMESTFSEQAGTTGLVSESASSSFPSFISEWSSNFQVSKIYGVSNAGTTPASAAFNAGKRFYGKPETEIKLDDYVKLPIMEEVFFELVPRVILKSENGKYDLYIIDPLRNRMYNYPPEIFIDGVIFNDPAVVGTMDPSNVYMIDVVKAQYVVGDYHFPGIISIFTKSTDYKNMALPPNAVRIPYQVAEAAIPFYSPDYTSTAMRNRRIPDFRNTLYWNPSIKPGKDGKYKVEFWSSDFASDYDLAVQVVSAGGECVSAVRRISVK